MKKLHSQKGFTLVELAIVMTIIGLLIGGILKGQELINNARITASVAQIKAYQAATTTFRDQYNATPGDMANATTRLANCAAAGCNGSGNGRVGTGNWTTGQAAITGDSTGDDAQEMTRFWAHLNTANLVEGVTTTGTNIGQALGYGTTNPAGRLSGTGFKVASNTGTGANGGATPPAGLVAVMMGGTLGDNLANTEGLGLTPKQAAQIDRKMDDGIPASGSVVAGGATGATNACYTAASGTTPSAYNEAEAGVLCYLVVGIDG